jgi:hypothetical protein
MLEIKLDRLKEESIKKGLSIAEISELTGFSVDEIQALLE